MKNKYYVLRHGNSLANREGIIISDPDSGINGYGLTDIGFEDVKSSVERFLNDNNTLNNIKIISSPFKRTRESAETAAMIIGVENIIYDSALKERYFGIFEGCSNKNYEKVWELDKDNPEHKEFGVESVIDVYKRATNLVNRFEKDHKNQTFILVSHGDTSQILECFFKNVSPGEHRSLKNLKQGELRLLS